MKEILKVWNKEIFGYLDLEVDKVMANMNDLDYKACSCNSINDLGEVREEASIKV